MFYVSLFGHREIEDLQKLEARLARSVEELMVERSKINFLIGRNGEFDEYAASVIKRVRRKFEEYDNEITLVLPYKVANIEYYDKYYDGIIIPDCTLTAHPKLAITLKNHWMVERSDLLIVYVERETGGAYAAMKYAERLGKRVINLAGQEG